MCFCYTSRTVIPITLFVVVAVEGGGVKTHTLHTRMATNKMRPPIN